MTEDQENPLDDIKEDLRHLGLKRNSTPLLFYGSNIDYNDVSFLLRLLRSEDKIENLDFIIDSGGGDLTLAVKMARICKNYSKKLTVIVPFFAKSAATIIALSADDLIFGKAGELGPLDPQVKHPALDMFFPASSIKNALEFIESSKDPYIKMTMADKLDPFLIGAYNKTIEEAKQYLMEIPQIRDSENRDEIIATFTKKYADHGFPITQEICSRLNLKFSLEFNNNEIENLIYDIHDSVSELIANDNLKTLILSANNAYVGINDEDFLDMDEEGNDEDDIY